MLGPLLYGAIERTTPDRNPPFHDLMGGVWRRR